MGERRGRLHDQQRSAQPLPVARLVLIPGVRLLHFVQLLALQRGQKVDRLHQPDLESDHVITAPIAKFRLNSLRISSNSGL